MVKPFRVGQMPLTLLLESEVRSRNGVCSTMLLKMEVILSWRRWRTILWNIRNYESVLTDNLLGGNTFCHIGQHIKGPLLFFIASSVAWWTTPCRFSQLSQYLCFVNTSDTPLCTLSASADNLSWLQAPFFRRDTCWYSVLFFCRCGKQVHITVAGKRVTWSEIFLKGAYIPLCVLKRCNFLSRVVAQLNLHWA